MANLMELIKAKAKIVDVRSPGEFSEGHYPNAVNIPVDQIQTRLNDFGPKDQPIIVYCASGARSAFAAKFLKSSGWSTVVNAGGLEDMP